MKEWLRLSRPSPTRHQLLLCCWHFEWSDALDDSEGEAKENEILNAHFLTIGLRTEERRRGSPSVVRISIWKKDVEEGTRHFSFLPPIVFLPKCDEFDTRVHHYLHLRKSSVVFFKCLISSIAFFLLLFIISLSLFFPSVLFLFDSRNVHCLHPSTELDASFCCCFFR